MKAGPILLMLASLSALGCRNPPFAAQGRHPIVHQGQIADIACGPCAMFNWMSHGGDELQTALVSLSAGRTPEATVRGIIDTYGARRSATNPSVPRYGRHNGGVGSINLMVMARELLSDHLPSPPDLRGEYLHRREGEAGGEHLERILGWFGDSIDSGIPVMLYLRAYERNSDGQLPRMLFGHHVVVTSFDAAADSSHGRRGIGFAFVDSGSGRVDHGELLVAKLDFTAPTFMYRLDGDRALTTESLRTGRPLLEVRIPSYESANPPGRVIVVAHFATFSGKAAGACSTGRATWDPSAPARCRRHEARPAIEGGDTGRGRARCGSRDSEPRQDVSRHEGTRGPLSGSSIRPAGRTCPDRTSARGSPAADSQARLVFPPVLEG